MNDHASVQNRELHQKGARKEGLGEWGSRMARIRVVPEEEARTLCSLVYTDRRVVRAASACIAPASLRKKPNSHRTRWLHYPLSRIRAGGSYCRDMPARALRAPR